MSILWIKFFLSTLGDGSFLLIIYHEINVGDWTIYVYGHFKVYRIFVCLFKWLMFYYGLVYLKTHAACGIYIPFCFISDNNHAIFPTLSLYSLVNYTFFTQESPAFSTFLANQIQPIFMHHLKANELDSIAKYGNEFHCMKIIWTSLKRIEECQPK